GDEDAAVAVLALDRAGVGDLPAARRVERRLGELDERPAVALEQPGHGRVLLEVLVAGELAGLRRDLAHDVRDAARDHLRARRRARPLLVHEPGELRVAPERDAALLGDLAREVDREAVRVVQAERVLAGHLPAREEIVEQARPLLERPPEALLLRADPLLDRLPARVQLRIRG